MPVIPMDVLFSNRPFGVKRFQTIHHHSVDVAHGLVLLFSNRPFGVKRFQTIHHHSVDVAHGLVLLFGIGTKPFQYGIRRRGGTIFRAALPSVDGRTKQTCELTSSIVPRGTSSTARWSSGFLLSN